MAKKIPLTQGKYAIVDDEDFEWLSQWSWYYHKCGYACRKATVEERKQGFSETILMHRFILGIADGDSGIFIDHVNMNGLDNRKNNLRICTPAENLRNAGKQRNNTTGYLGVTYNKRDKKFQAQIQYNSKHHFLGYYPTPEEAAFARDVAAKILFGEFFHANNVQIDAHKAQEIEAAVINRLAKKGLIDAA